MEAIDKLCRGHATRVCQPVSNDHDLPEWHEDEHSRETDEEEESDQPANAWLDNILPIPDIPSSCFLAHREDVRSKPT